MENIETLLRNHGCVIKGSGAEKQTNCPFSDHEDKVASFTFNTDSNLWHCKGCQKKGHYKQIYAYFHPSSSVKDVNRAVGRSKLVKNKAKYKKAQAEKYPMSVYPTFEMEHIYYDEESQEQFRILRRAKFKGKEMGKVIPIHKDGNNYWRFSLPAKYKDDKKKKAEKRPLYNLKKLQGTTGNVIIVEGEGLVDKMEAMKVGKNTCVLTWCGGASNTHNADWNKLRNRDVYLVADRDEPGRNAMNNIAFKLYENKCKVFIYADLEENDGYDLEDLGLLESKQKLQDFLANSPLRTEYKPTQIEVDNNKPKEEKADELDVGIFEENEHWRTMGYTDSNLTTASFLLKEMGVVYPVNPAQISTPHFLTMLCDDEKWWEGYIGDINKPQDRSKIMFGLKRALKKRGVFTEDDKVYRGAFQHDNRIWWHLGKSVMTPDGNIIALEKSPKLAITDGSIAPKSEPCNVEFVKELHKVIMDWRWESQDMGRKFSGWLIAAMVGGALKWHPHIWLVTGVGVGKSWVLTDLLPAIYGPMFPESRRQYCKTTTAAHIGNIGSESLPYALEEMDNVAGSHKFQQHMDEVLDIVRGASSASVRQSKMSPSGHIIYHKPCASMILVSTKRPAQQDMDLSRIDEIRVGPPMDMDKFMEYEMDLMKFLKKSDSFRAFVMRRTEDIVRSVQYAREHIYRHIKNQEIAQRVSDQRGTLLGCAAWFCDPDNYRELILDESFYKPFTEVDYTSGNVAQAYLYSILQKEMQLQIKEGEFTVNVRKNITEMLEIINSAGNNSSDAPQYKKYLANRGLRYERGSVVEGEFRKATIGDAYIIFDPGGTIAKSSLLNDQKWSNPESLLRGEKTITKSIKKIRVGDSRVGKMLFIPWETLFPRDEDGEPAMQAKPQVVDDDEIPF